MDTFYSKWTTAFRKILVCIGILVLGTLCNITEPKALAIAVIVQGGSNIDSFCDYLNNKRIHALLRAMSVILVLLSVAAILFAIVALKESGSFFDTKVNTYAGLYISLVVFAVASPIIPLITDMTLNIKKELKNKSEEEEIEF